MPVACTASSVALGRSAGLMSRSRATKLEVLGHQHLAVERVVLGEVADAPLRRLARFAQGHAVEADRPLLGIEVLGDPCAMGVDFPAPLGPEADHLTTGRSRRDASTAVTPPKCLETRSKARSAITLPPPSGESGRQFYRGMEGVSSGGREPGGVARGPATLARARASLSELSRTGSGSLRSRLPPEGDRGVSRVSSRRSVPARWAPQRGVAGLAQEQIDQGGDRPAGGVDGLRNRRDAERLLAPAHCMGLQPFRLSWTSSTSSRSTL